MVSGTGNCPGCGRAKRTGFGFCTRNSCRSKYQVLARGGTIRAFTYLCRLCGRRTNSRMGVCNRPGECHALYEKTRYRDSHVASR